MAKDGVLVSVHFDHFKDRGKCGGIANATDRDGSESTDARGAIRKEGDEEV
jgi:hypothetical protein